MRKIIRKGSKKGTLVCIHGNSSSSDVFESLLNSNNINHTVVAVNLPGHKNNLDDFKHHTDFSMSFFKESLIEEINTIKDEIILVGNSMGAHLAIEIANDINHLKGLIIFGAPPVKKPINFEEAFLPVEALQTYFTANPPEEAIDAAANIAVENKEKAALVANYFKSTNPLVRKHIAEDIFSGNLDNQYKIYTNLLVPKFIIAGDKDASVNFEYLKKVNDNSKNSELIIFENCGHYPSLEKPTEFLETMILILSKIF
ncbi:alpha/beta hydrolase [Polaribacter sp. R77954]|uniref:alpha/beta hydrolase n=1 Tax=Polaribacter sp. R77954 TaxID=3093870 RepID=UPI0037C8AE3F